jgi:hypothetical protein
MRSSQRIICAVIILFTSASACWAEVQVRPDQNNVVSSRLEGEWEADDELTKRLGGRAKGKVEFQSDKAVAAKIPAKFDTFFKGKQVYMAGMMKFGEKQFPFVLIEHTGNPHLVFFQERDGDPLGDTESINVMLARGKEPKDDLLFIGGDFNNQPFGAYRRVHGGEK